MNKRELKSQQNRGIATAFICYTIWGLLPIFWKLLEEVNSMEIIAQRIIWCFVSMMIICAATHQNLRELLKQSRAWRFLAPAAAIITLNWSIYIYAVNSDHVVEAAIGYYINPLVSIVLGMIVFRERLTRLQSIAVGLCIIGVLFFTYNYGRFPWIAIALAVSFGIYGAVKKKAAYPPVPALAFENIVLIIPTIIFSFVLAHITGEHAFGANLDTTHGIYLTVLLILAGPATAIPLTLFSKAANMIPLSLLGFIQYFSPTLTLLVGVLLFNEPFTFAHKMCLLFIWMGLGLVSYDSLRESQKD